MKNYAQAVVIGGGLIGCSILYHLTKLGWKDVVLLERNELTSGSTWHAAANIHGLHDNNNISKMQYYTMRLYKELEKETGQSCGIYQPGSLYLAQTESRAHQLRMQAQKAKQYGVDFHELSVSEAQSLHPLVNFDNIRLIMFEKDGGNVDPSGVTHAYAKGARQNGAQIERFTEVIATEQKPDGGWLVKTTKGDIECEVLVNAAGLWGREVGRMAGLELPLIPMEHQYLVTESMPEIEGIDRLLPSVADRDGEYYLRQEGKGLLVGAYEKDGRFWAEHGTPLDFAHDLFEDDLERISENFMNAIARIPALESAGIKRVINGPMIWSPDGGALMGPVPQLKNYYLCVGIIPGFSQSGGLGSQLAEWIVHKETEFDLFGWDHTRFGNWTTKSYTMASALDQYSHRFKIHFPEEQRTAGRPVRTRPVYEKQKSLRAVFGLAVGWEHPLWFAEEGREAREEYGFTRQEWWHDVGFECRHLRKHVGIIDISNFAKYDVKGEGSYDWLNRLFANKIPTLKGRSCLTPLLGERGGMVGDFTLTCVDDEHYRIFGSGLAQDYHRRYFQKIPLPSSVTFTNLTEAWCGFSVAGPKARALLQGISNYDFSNENFPFMRSASLSLSGIEVFALRVSFTGDLGWEIYCKSEDQPALYELLLAQSSCNVRPIGSRALMSLRLEKGYGSWGREFSAEYWPHEVGYERLVKLDKGEFLGKAAYEAVLAKNPREKLVGLIFENTEHDAWGSEPIFSKEGLSIGRVTSGGYSYSQNLSIALAMIKTEYAQAGNRVKVAILGKETEAEIWAQPVFDPEGHRARA